MIGFEFGGPLLRYAPTSRLWAYRGSLPPESKQSWTACLLLLAAAWIGTLPLLGALWRFAPPLERRLPFWTTYWIGLFALPIVILIPIVSNARRRKRGLARPPETASLLIGILTTWPIMHLAAWLAFERALPMTLKPGVTSGRKPGGGSPCGPFTCEPQPATESV